MVFQSLGISKWYFVDFSGIFGLLVIFRGFMNIQVILEFFGVDIAKGTNIMEVCPKESHFVNGVIGV